MNENVHFSGSSINGINITCPCCEGLLWINLSWPGLPIFSFNEKGELDRPFICAWCTSVLAIHENNTLIILQRKNSLNFIGSNDLIIIKESELSLLLLNMVSNRAIKKDSFFQIGGNFKGKDDLLSWCSTTVNHLTQSNKLVRLSVIDI